MQCIAPILIKNPNFNGQDSHTPVRCGKCEACTKNTITGWSFRLSQEAKKSIYVDFVTLTYEPHSVPLTDDLTHTLSKRDVQLFLKRLRKKCNRNIKYFAVGEYGSTSYRPHYHLIIYGVDNRQKIIDSWKKDDVPIGNVHIGETVTEGAIPYTLKYMSKAGLVPAFPGDKRLPEFRIMSKQLGICYLTPAIEKWHMQDFPNRQYCVTSTGHKIALPRFYKEKLISKYNYDRSKLITNDTPYGIIAEDDDPRTLRSIIDNKKAMQRTWKQEKLNKLTRSKI